MRITADSTPKARQSSARAAARPQSATKACAALVRSSALRARDSTIARSATAAEAQGNRQRWEESGKSGSIGSWEWSLNWDEVTQQVLVGACPRSAEDVVTLRRSANVDAILCLQSDGCFEALKIDYNSLRQQGTDLGMIMSRVAVWDFNHEDQALMIPEAIRKLALLVAMGKRVYVHCTAGINRATLTVVGYLTFVKGWQLDDAVREVKSKRPQAHPYIDCWHTMRARLTEGRTEEVIRTAARIYEERKAAGKEGKSDSLGDWVKAETVLITELFQRQIQSDLSMMVSLNDLERARVDESVCLSMDEFNNMQAEMGVLREKAEQDRAQARAALAQAAHASEENRRLREAKPEVAALLESSEKKAARLKAAEKEINALKHAIREVAFAAFSAATGNDDDSVRASGLLSPPDSDAAANGAHLNGSGHTAPSGNGNGASMNGNGAHARAGADADAHGSNGPVEGNGAHGMNGNVAHEGNGNGASPSNGAGGAV